MAGATRDPKIGVAAIGAVLTALAERGIDPAAFCAELGLDPSIAADPDGRLPLRLLDTVWNRAADRLGDPHLGLHLARSTSAGTFGLLSYLGSSAPTWGDGLRKVCGYFRLLSEGSAYHLDVEGDRAIVTATQDGPIREPVRHRVEFTIAVLIGYGRRLIDGDWTATDIFLEHAAPPGRDLDEHLHTLGRLPRFDAGASGFTFPRALLDRPLQSSEPRLAAVLEDLASRRLADTPEPTSLARRVRSDLLGTGLDGEISLQAVAKRLGMSPRTLQRRLRDESTSLADVVDDVRRAEAVRMLKGEATCIAEVAYAIGFSEPAAFHRAFKRWTGLTPAEYRRASARRM